MAGYLMEECPVCGSENKIVLDNYVIKTRIPGKEQILVKDIHYYQCSICDNKMLTETSEDIVGKIRDYYMDKYYNNYRKETNRNKNNVKKILRKIGVIQ